MNDIEHGVWPARIEKAKKRIKALENAIEFVIQWNENTIACTFTVPEMNGYLEDVLSGKYDEEKYG